MRAAPRPGRFPDAFVSHRRRAPPLVRRYVILRGFWNAQETDQKRRAAADMLSRAALQPGSLAFSDGRTTRASIGGCPWSASWNRAAAEAGVDAGDGDALNPGRITYIDDVHGLDADMERHMRSEKLLGAVSSLLGGDVDAYQCAFVIKPPETDIAYHGWHQDIVDYGGTSLDGDGEYFGMTNFGNLLTITYLSAVGPGHGSTKLAPRFHRTPDGREGPVRPRLHIERSDGLDPPGTSLRSLAGADELDAAAVTPTFEAGDLLIADSWLPHRVESNADPISKIGLINVFCRNDCVPTDPERCGKGADEPVMRGGQVLPPIGHAASGSSKL